MILYIQTAFLGDLLLSIPALRRLRKIYPDKKIHLLCRKGLGEFFVNEGLADKVFDNFKSQKPSLAEVKKTFAGVKYELLICPHQSTRSTLISFFIKADKKIGYESLMNRMVFDEVHPRPMHWPEVLRQLDLLKNLSGELKEQLASVENQEAPFSEIPRWSSMAMPRFSEKKTFKGRLQKKYGFDVSKKIIVVAAGSVWPTKRWGVEKYIELIKKFKNDASEVFLVGSPSEKDLSAQIAEAVPGVTDITGQTTIPELMDVIAGADLLLSNDSGAMHMASVTDVPTVAIFGPTVLSFGYQPWNPRAKVMENKNLKCRPCSSHGGKTCPIGTHECMLSIPADQVFSAGKSLF